MRPNWMFWKHCAPKMRLVEAQCSHRKHCYPKTPQESSHFSGLTKSPPSFATYMTTHVGLGRQAVAWSRATCPLPPRHLVSRRPASTQQIVASAQPSCQPSTASCRFAFRLPLLLRDWGHGGREGGQRERERETDTKKETNRRDQGKVENQGIYANEKNAERARYEKKSYIEIYRERENVFLRAE